MIIFRESNKDIIKTLGPNCFDNSQKHRLMKYLIVEDVDNGKAIHNELTRSFIWIPNDQWCNLNCEDTTSLDYMIWLWGNYFIVNENFDEEAVQERLKRHYRPNPENPSYLSSGNLFEYTIFTTMACNARCSYCYEKGRPQLPMTSKTAEKVAEYIIHTAVKNGNPIQLRWFGGEPLVNENVIDIICNAVRKAGFNYESSFTTNGLLFKEEKLEKYIKDWHIKFAQITLDGTEETYNKIKNYKNVKGTSPYQIVIRNIKMLLNHNISIAIRMNMDQNNYENIKLLIKEIYTIFGNNKNLNPYCYPIFDDYENKPRTEEENEIVFTQLKEIEEILKSYNYRIGEDRRYNISSTHCMIDNGHAVVIGTQGDIGLCEHYSEDNFWGHVSKPDMKDMDMVKSFQEYIDVEDICKTCPILPSCIRPKKCHDLCKCSIWTKEWHIRSAHQGVKNMYNMFKLNKNNKYTIFNGKPNLENNTCNNQNNCINNYVNDKQKIHENFLKEANEYTINEKHGLSKLWENILIFVGLK